MNTMMTTTDHPESTARTSPRWGRAAFRAAFGVTLGILAALLLMLTLAFVLLGGAGGASVHVEETPAGHRSAASVALAERPDREALWTDCPADACIMLPPRSRSV